MAVSEQRERMGQHLTGADRVAKLLALPGWMEDLKLGAPFKAARRVAVSAPHMATREAKEQLPTARVKTFSLE